MNSTCCIETLSCEFPFLYRMKLPKQHIIQFDSIAKKEKFVSKYGKWISWVGRRKYKWNFHFYMNMYSFSLLLITLFLWSMLYEFWNCLYKINLYLAASQSVKKIIEINPYMLGTMAGGAADCQFWHRNLGIKVSQSIHARYNDRESCIFPFCTLHYPTMRCIGYSFQT